MSTGGREAWRRRALTAERGIENAWRTYLREIDRREAFVPKLRASGFLTEEEIVLGTAESTRELLTIFGATLYENLVSMLHHYNPDGPWLAVAHPMVVFARGRFCPTEDKFFVDTSVLPVDGHKISLLVHASTSATWKGARIGAWEPACYIMHDETRTPLAFELGCYALSVNRDARRTLSICLADDTWFSLGAFFQNWVRWKSNVTLQLLTRTMYKELPRELKKIIVCLVRDCEFNTHMDWYEDTYEVT